MFTNEYIEDIPPVPRYQIIILVRSRITNAQWQISLAIDESNFDKARFYTDSIKKDIGILETILEEEEQE
jgi:hypothetical protein